MSKDIDNINNTLEDIYEMLENLSNRLSHLESQNYELLLDNVNKRVDFIDNFLINNTRGYYLKELKRKSD